MAELTDAQIDERIRRYHDVACGYQLERDAALAEMLKWSQDVVRLQARLATLTAALERSDAALREMLALVEEGWLVRNTTNDAARAYRAARAG